MYKMHWTEARDMLRCWREENARKSLKVVDVWESVLAKKMNKLGDEKLLVLEQVCVAALDCNRQEVADYCLKALRAEFPTSLRVHRLRVLQLEALEQYDEALDLLEKIIKQDETNAAPAKRKVAILKAKGRTSDAIKELAEYLKKYMSDKEGWQELCELYLFEQDFSKAAFCMEELILHNPHSHLIHQRYADIKYTQLRLGMQEWNGALLIYPLHQCNNWLQEKVGQANFHTCGTENMDIAKAHYCLALKINPNNIRALYGLFMCVTNIALNQKVTPLKRKTARKLAKWTLKELNSRYEDKRVQVTPMAALEGLIDAVHITAS